MADKHHEDYDESIPKFKYSELRTTRTTTTCASTSSTYHN
jgi:hypothetical protein